MKNCNVIIMYLKVFVNGRGGYIYFSTLSFFQIMLQNSGSCAIIK